jgi:SAM-dependent methyltransferase
MVLRRKSAVTRPLEALDLAITDSNYGQTEEIYQCLDCGFRQCSRIKDPLPLYESLQDSSYEAGREYRSLQAMKLLQVVRRHKQSGKLLDIGAGSGIMLEEAGKLGFDAWGVEPSHWLCDQAGQRGLRILQGTFPHKEISGQFDVITLVDVLEHVTDPIGLLRSISDALSPDGIGFVVTPDISSLAARVLRWKWWHFRLAHVGYFNKGILSLALDKASLEALEWGRPGWYFSADYLVDRLNRYLPKFLRVPSLAVFEKLTIPLNLWDSLYAIFRRKG